MSSHETVSKSDLEKLRRELLEMRKAAGIPEPVQAQHHPKEVYASATLIESMDRLHIVLDKLVRLFENANRQVYDEYERGLKDTEAKLEQVISQNEKIARGVVALADIVRSRAATAPIAAPRQERSGSLLSAEASMSPAPVRGQAAEPVYADQSAVPAAAPSAEDESFLRQPVTQISAPRTAAAPPSEIQASVSDDDAEQQALQALATAATPSARTGYSDLPPPPPPPTAAGRRNLLNKFSYR